MLFNYQGLVLFLPSCYITVCNLIADLRVSCAI